MRNERAVNDQVLLLNLFKWVCRMTNRKERDDEMYLYLFLHVKLMN